MEELETQRKVFKQIAQTIIAPVISVVVFFVWSYTLIKSQPPQMLTFPLSSLIVTALYFFSGPIYSGVMLAFITVAGFLCVFLTDSNLYRLIFLAETFLLWVIFLFFEHYQKGYDGLENRNREEEETLESKAALLSSKIEESKKRTADLSQRIENYQSLGNMVHLMGLTLEEEKMIPLICDLALRFIGKGTWKIKKGTQTDVFAQYVKSQQMPLIIGTSRPTTGSRCRTRGSFLL